MSNESNKWEFGLGAVLMGVLGLVAAFAVVAFTWRDQTGIAALGSIASPIVAIVSAYFGIQYSQKAAQNAVDATKDAEARAGAAEHDRVRAVESLRRTILPRLKDAAESERMPEPQADGFAAKAWDDARRLAGV